jgi:hypothetical protein
VAAFVVSGAAMGNAIRFDGPGHLDDFLRGYVERKKFRRWVNAALTWADFHGINVSFKHNEEWGMKIVLRDSLGEFFDYAYALNGKKGESDDEYDKRVWKTLNAECCAIRKLRTAQVVGKAS